jgi:hypothetical protein
MADPTFPRPYEVQATNAAIVPAGVALTVAVAPGQAPVYDSVNNVVTFVLGTPAIPTEGTGT